MAFPIPAAATADLSLPNAAQGFSMAAEIVTKVLLVDDDDMVLDHLKPLITAAGYEVVTAPSSEAALVSMQQDFAPIVITDINMPGMDGLGLCRAIRRETYSGYVYVMLHTAKEAEKDILAGLEAGADDYLSKRTPKSQLIGRLRTAQRVLSLEHSLKTALQVRERMAMTDVLTGAHNRRYLLEHLSHEIDRTRRLRGELSVLVLDFDHFSRINDRYGHAAGDAALKEVVQRIHKSLRRNCDWCARLGGDEFVVVLPQTDMAGASVVAEKLRSAIETTSMRIGEGIVRVTVSVGASGLGAVTGCDATPAQTLLDLADQCLYKSKKAGRNRVTVPDMADVASGLHQVARDNAMIRG
jgi:diguanylate cyclase (GGDEF)-like protein